MRRGLYTPKTGTELRIGFKEILLRMLSMIDPCPSPGNRIRILGDGGRISIGAIQRVQYDRRPRSISRFGEPGLPDLESQALKTDLHAGHH